MPNIMFVLLPDLRLDAAVEPLDFDQEQGYRIKLNSGWYFAIKRMFDVILCNPTTFPSIGNPALETADVSVTVETLPELLGQLVYADDLPQPVDETRRLFARHMTDLVIRFVIEHELAHIIAGHIDLFSRSISELMSFNELTDTEQSFALEMHADEIAFFNCFRWVRDSVADPTTKSPKWCFINTIDAQFHDLYVAIYAFFQLIDHVCNDGCHPNPIHRQVRVAAMFSYAAKEFNLKLMNKPIDLVAEVVREFDKYMGVVFDLDWNERSETFDATFKDFHSVIMPYSKHVTSLFLPLRKHAYVRLEVD